MLSLNLNLSLTHRRLLPTRHLLLGPHSAGPTTTTHFPLKTTPISPPSLLLLRRCHRHPVAGCPAGDSSRGSEIPESPATPQLSIVFGLWYFQSIVFNITNTIALSFFPYPWFMASFQLLVGSALTAALWSLRLQPRPKATRAFLGALLAPALFHAVGHVASCVAFSKASLLAHVIKSSEPVFAVAAASALGDRYPLTAWLSILPVALGCSLAAVSTTEAAFITQMIKIFGAVMFFAVVLRGRFPFPARPSIFPIVVGWAASEVRFNPAGVWGALISNVGFVLRNIYSKKSLNSFQEINGLNLYGCITILSLIYLFPVAVFVEGSQWVKGYHKAVVDAGNPMTLYLSVMIASVFYHLYNQSSYKALDQISPLTFSVGNAMKPLVAMVLMVIVFRNRVSPLNVAGLAMAILGTFLYSRGASKRNKNKKPAREGLTR